MESDESTDYSLKLREATAARDQARVDYGRAIIAQDTDAAAEAWARWQAAAERLAQLAVDGDRRKGG